MMKRYWSRLPWDGEGWTDAGDPALAVPRRRAAARWRREQAPIPSGIIWLASRALWPLAAAAQVARLSRRLKGLAPATVYADCVRTGAAALEAHVWRSLHASPHPLPARASALLLARLGAPAEQRILTDKWAAAATLSAPDVVFPKLVRLLRSGEPLGPAAELRTGGALFVKPRHGHGGRGCFALEPADDGWRVDGRPVPETELLAHIARGLRQDDLLIEERVRASAALEDLAGSGRAPVLRLVTARWPGGTPFLHSALLAIGVPGRNPRHFIEGTVFAAVDIASGRLAPGMALARPGDRLSALPWNAARLEGRALPDFDAATRAALSAMSALPGLPVVHWDLILADTGAVMLEGNVSGNWILASLPERDNLASGSLAQVLAAWSRPEEGRA